MCTMTLDPNRIYRKKDGKKTPGEPGHTMGMSPF